MPADRPRPYIPLAVRFQVAYRQRCLAGPLRNYLDHSHPLKARIADFLKYLFGDEAYQLDHDPALILRDYNPRTGKYTPDANDPEFLFYRRKNDHLQKTTGRKADAEKTVTTKGSDIWLKSKFNRLEGRTKKRPKTKWPKGRKLQGRKFQ